MTDGSGSGGLARLDWEAFRHLQSGSITPGVGLNIICGRNAAGKTSLLESIHFLARARSFLTHRSSELVNTQSNFCRVTGRIQSLGKPHQLGIQYGDGETRVRLDGQDIHALSDSAWLLPIQVINTEAQRLLTDGPEVRRAFLNWGVFHVEPTYRETWKRYQKALRQRNAALRVGDARLAAAWEPEMASAGVQVDVYRQQFLSQVLSSALQVAQEWLPDQRLDWRYRSGWAADADLVSVLAEGRDRDLAQGFSFHGPHRADFKLLTEGVEAARRLSRGQQKLLVAALRLALIDYWCQQSDQRPVVLVDDLPAELDAVHRSDLLQRLQQIPAQVFVTAIEAEYLPDVVSAQWFHVEHGEVRSGRA